jgi:hypothetical protein
MKIDLKRFISSYWILILLVCVKFILQYVVINPVYELHRDEFLYLNQADHLSFGYISVPPFTALISKLIFLLGGSIFWIHFFPALFGALTVIFTWLIVESLGGSLFSKTLAAAALTFSLLIRINILLQPNSFDILSWTIIFYFLIRYIQSEKSGWLMLLSVTVALSFYNKYNVIFLIAGLAAGLALTYNRKIFINFSFWKALILCLILLSPNIIWQVSHQFPVFQHMKVLKSNQLDNNTTAGFLISQVMFFFGSLPLILAGLVSFVFYKPLRPFRVIGISFVTVIFLFALMKAKGYYAVGIYPVIIAAGCVYLDGILSKKWRTIIFPFLITFNLVVFISIFRLIFPILTPDEIRQNAGSFEKMGLLRWEDGKNHNLPQDFADMLGWHEMADKSLLAYKMIPAEELANTLIICNNYGQAGALNFYNRGKMPEAYAFNTDYIYWLPKIKKIKNIVLIGEKPSKEIIGLFKDCRLTGAVENEQARERNTGVYLLTGAIDMFTPIFYNKVEERKKKMEIF